MNTFPNLNIINLEKSNIFVEKQLMPTHQTPPDKKEIYRDIFVKTEKLFDPSLSRCVNLCQVLAVLKHDLHLFWAGIYVWNGGKLKLDAFQGDIACTEIEAGKGVCGTAFSENRTVNVKDVNDIENYIACHEDTLSEIVIPGNVDGKPLFVLDIDSEKPAYFEAIDEENLEHICKHLEKIYSHYGRN